MKKIITLLVAVAIVLDLFSPLRMYIEGGKALSMLIPTVIIILYDRLFVRKSFLPICLYILTCFLLMLMDSEFFDIPQLISLLFAYACLEHFLLSQDNQFAKVILNTVYITLLITIGMSIPLFVAMPNLSRLMIEAEEQGITDPMMYWTIQYPTIHALPVYSIPLLFLTKMGKSTVLRLLSLLAIIAIMVLMFFADATTALILTIGIYGLLLLYNPKRTLKDNSIKLGFVGIALLFLLNKTVLIGLLRASQQLFEGSSNYAKIDEIILSISGGGSSGDMEARENQLNISVKSFFSNPLFPEMNMNNIGHHNYLIDQIVAMGLLPAITFIWFLIERIKRPFKYLSGLTKPYYGFCIITLLVMALIKNFFLFFPACCIVPMMFIMIERFLIKKK